ncbi:hypothetical protein [Parasitella parasitica]|uniref:Uncharacterized protein n=1 Tax=Parasitella parasitica TaxID=35722 RepID=A0A0B7NDW1_9FUNG|nr:hypothetical protein [Parasitella parasitica]
MIEEQYDIAIFTATYLLRRFNILFLMTTNNGKTFRSSRFNYSLINSSKSFGQDLALSAGNEGLYVIDQ